ncbi:hypothetical protein GCM10010129_19600 [Streptomyces fumigatiscleroticus]|nr:hypothetical protein GCM10010129_19600 [Streptomyces fumigatiscleroticus]
MADEQYRWLDRETAEILLRGESPEAVDPAAREQAERLARTLGALSGPTPPTSDELPGEAAALAAFRKVRAERDGAGAAVSGRGADAEAAGAQLVRIGARDDRARRSRRGRSLRYGLAAALAVGMLGGGAVAAGTGVLPTPFVGDEPDPTASVSVAATPGRPLVSPSPEGTAGGVPAPGLSLSDSSGESAAPDGTGGGTATEHGPDSDDGTARPGDSGRGFTTACRDLRAGKELQTARRRALESAAGGSPRVEKYCEGVLAEADGGAKGQSGAGRSGKDPNTAGGRQQNSVPETRSSQDGGDNGDDNGGDNGAVKGSGDNDEKDDDQGGQGGDDDGHHTGRSRGHHHRGAAAVSTPPALAPTPPRATTVSSATPTPGSTRAAPHLENADHLRLRRYAQFFPARV